MCSDEETLADLNAFNREYENDNSWEQLQEDEFGHLRPLVSLECFQFLHHPQSLLEFLCSFINFVPHGHLRATA